MNDLSQYKDSPPCSCEICKSYCARPCWPTPAEAEKLMDEGFAQRLMVDWWAKDGMDIHILCGASPGYEGDSAPFWPNFGCTFFVKGKCQLHHRGLKPLEGRVAHHASGAEHKNLHHDIALAWNSVEGRAAVKRWRKLADS